MVIWSFRCLVPLKAPVAIFTDAVSASKTARKQAGAQQVSAAGFLPYIGLVGIISSIVSLTAPNPYIILRQTLDRMSSLDTGIFVLFTSFVGHLAAFSEPGS